MWVEAIMTMHTTTTTAAADSWTYTWLTASEMARQLRLHEKTILRLAAAGVIPCLRAGRAARFPAELVVEALLRRETR